MYSMVAEQISVCCLQIWMQDGIRGFYRGCSANLLRTTPAAALTFTTFELIARNMRHAAAERREQAVVAAGG